MTQKALNVFLCCSDRALCYIQLELNKHAIKDCNAATKYATAGETARALLIKGRSEAGLRFSHSPSKIEGWSMFTSALMQ